MLLRRGSRRRAAIPLAVVALAGVASVGSAGCSHGDPIVGCWQWGSANGGVVEAFPDGTLTHDGSDSGQWTDEGGGKYVLVWKSGWVDGITLENGVLYETHLAAPPGQGPGTDFVATPTSCSNLGSSGPPGGGGTHCGASGSACSSSADCCGVCELDPSSSFYLTCE